MTYGSAATKRMRVIGTTANYGQSQLDPARSRPRLHAGRGRPAPQRRRAGPRAGHDALPRRRSDRQAGPHRTAREYTVVGVFGKRPNPLGGTRPTSSRSSRTPPGRRSTAPTRCASSASSTATSRSIVIPRDDVTQAAAMREIEEIMRARHGLRLDQENDFDIATAGRAAQVLGADQRRHLPRAGRDLVDRADGRRHRRDGDHDHQRHRADPRDRRPQGARRAPPRDPLAVPARGRVPDLARRAASASCSAPASAG